MAAMEACRRRLQLLPELEMWLRSHARIPYPSWVKGVVRFRPGPPARMLVSCRQVDYGERNAGEMARQLPQCFDSCCLRRVQMCNCLLVLSRQRRIGSRGGQSPDEQLTDGKDDDGTAVEDIGESFGDELAQLSLEEEQSDDVVSGISESIVRDVEKAAVELLAARAFTVSELRKKLRAKKFPDNAVDSVIANFKSRGLLNDGYYAESF